MRPLAPFVRLMNSCSERTSLPIAIFQSKWRSSLTLKLGSCLRRRSVSSRSSSVAEIVAMGSG